MGKWIHTQFEEQFFVYERSACADIVHVTEYLIDAGGVLAGADQGKQWGMEHKRRMLADEYEHVLADLKEHVCTPACTTSDTGKCLVRVADSYLSNHREYMNRYAELIIANLPVGSGEAESGIRHVIKRRMAVAGAWTEENASLLLALITIRKSGWWDDFWRWRVERDRQAWRQRETTQAKVIFRGKRRAARNQSEDAPVN